MRKKIIDELIALGVPVGVFGFEYIVDAIELIQDKEWRDGKIVALYYEISKKNNVPSTRVERCIRSALESALKNDASEELKMYLKAQEPTNRNILHALYYKILGD